MHGNGVDQPLLWYEGDQTDSASQRGLFANHQGSIAAIADSTGNAIAINGAACPELVSVMLMVFPMTPISAGSNIVCPSHAGSMAK